MLSMIRNMALVVGLTCAQVSSFAMWCDLSPGQCSQGAGNLGGGQAYLPEPGSFYVDHSFYMRWLDTSTPPSDRFMDLVGHVFSVSQSSSGATPFVFTGIELYSQDTRSLVGRYSSYPGSGDIDFTFARLTEGAYQIRFIGKANPEPPEGGWQVQEWEYSLSAVASPAPEASQLALSSIGLAAVVYWSRRNKRGTRVPA